MSTRSKSRRNKDLRVGLKDGRSKSGGNEGVGVDVKEGKSKSGGNEGLQVGVKEEEGFLDVEDLQELISYLKSLPNLLTWEDFRDRYHLECGPNSINLHRCRKDKEISNKTMQDLGLKAEGVRGRGGYFWSDCKVREIVNCIKYLHPTIYQHGADEIPRCITKQFMVGIVL